jgi:predicted amidohydrolase YtcJ
MQRDLILYNGSILTMDPRQPLVEALRIRERRILACGALDEIRALPLGDALEIDLEGRTALPGLEDAHLHLCMHGMALSEIDLGGTASLHQALERVRQASASQPGSGWLRGADWLRGAGWDHNLWPQPTPPTRHDLDSVVSDRPVALDSKDRHSLWVNSLALQLAGISADTPDSPGGQIWRDSAGQPTGILAENARRLIDTVVPPPDRDAWRQAAGAAIADCARYGITAVHSCEGPEAFRALSELEQTDELTVRVWHMLPLRVLDEAVALGLRTGYGSDRLRIGHVKMFADGALGSGTAEMLAPYEGQPGNLGVAATDTQTLLEAVSLAARHGLASAIHAIGDAANRRVLDIYAQVANDLAESAPQHGDLRHRIEHVQLLSKEDLPRLAAQGIIASMQPIHATHDRIMAERQWGARCRYAYAWRGLLDSGAHLAFGTDAPVEGLSPMPGLYAAVTRRDAHGEPPGGWYPYQRLGLDEALHAYTLGAAYAAYGERERGSLIPGKRGDVAVLSRDITAGPPECLLDTAVDLTIVDGEIIYERASGAIG